MSASRESSDKDEQQRVAVFVDVQNIYYTTRDAYGRQFNYRALWERVSQTGEIGTAYAYAIDRGDQRQQKFQNALRAIGFTVKLKPYIQRADGSAKGDWDVGITIDVLQVAPTVDRIVLLSGDGDFDLLVHEVREKYGIHVDVYGVPGLTANSLIEAATAFNAINEGLLL